jgi:hypothetical protein
MRIGSIVVVALAVAVLAPEAVPAKSPDRAALRSYLSKARVQMARYREAVRPLDQLGDPAYPDEEVPSLLGSASAGVDALVKPWGRVKAPHGLRRAHAGRTQSLQLVSRALSILGDGWAQFLITQSPEDLQAARDLSTPLFNTAKTLQVRWTKAVRAALHHAQVPVPRWLKLLGE